MADRAYSTPPQTWAWTLVRATGTSVAVAFLFFVALTGFAQPETLTSRPRVADAGGERPMMGPNHPKAVRSLPIVRQAVDDIASLAFLVRLLSNVPHSMVDGVAERSALRFLSVEIDVRAAKIMEALG